MVMMLVMRMALQRDFLEPLIYPARHTVLNQCTYVVIDEALKLQLLYAVMEAVVEAMAHRKIDKDGDSPRIAGLNDHSPTGGWWQQITFCLSCERL